VICRFSLVLLGLAGLLLFALAVLLLTCPQQLAAVLRAGIIFTCFAAAFYIASALLRILFSKK